MNDLENGTEPKRELVREEFPAPIGKLLGLMLTSGELGRATVEFEATAQHANPMGTLHGGVLCDIADAAMGAAYRSVLDDGESFTFANAGTAELAPLGGISEEHFDTIFNTNVKGVLFTVQKALPLMPDGGSIILNASIVASTGNPAFSVYSATKTAVRSFARTWILDLKERKIRVNAISPGPINTPGLDGLARTEGVGEPLKAGLLASVPLGRLGAPDEIARAAVFLASHDSSFVTGAELFVDGGAAQI
jgi:NAD(P)-dependent dehydrogenase (short-subunit alcohol dehydrogenase family)